MAGKPITFNVRFPMPYPAYADPERADRLVKQEFMVTMPGALDIIHGAVITETPFAFGHLRSSILPEPPYERGSNIIGEVKCASPYGMAVEVGSKPHWAPIEPLTLWVKRKLMGAGSALSKESGRIARRAGVAKSVTTEGIAEGIARMIQYKIARRGTKGWHMFARGFAKTKDKVGRLFGEANARILQKLRQK
jgi:hypothetical protein